jgi:hypothetical protein
LIHEDQLDFITRLEAFLFEEHDKKSR